VGRTRKKIRKENDQKEEEKKKELKSFFFPGKKGSPRGLSLWGKGLLGWGSVEFVSNVASVRGGRMVFAGLGGEFGDQAAVAVQRLVRLGCAWSVLSRALMVSVWLWRRVRGGRGFLVR